MHIDVNEVYIHLPVQSNSKSLD